MQQETAIFGGGCFWCTEAVFGMLKGVASVEPGYSGGHVGHPTYEQVSSGTTGHAEVIKIDYNPDEIAFEELLRVFFATHDPTTADRQGNDVGPQYRSVIFYANERQKEKAEHYIAAIQRTFSGKIMTAVEPFTEFYPAEDYHRKYYETHPDAAYCTLVIDPKVENMQKKFSHLLK